MASIENYDIGQLIGKGGFAEVYRVRHRSSGQDFALKVIDKNLIKQKKLEQRVVNEIQVHSALQHDSIVKLHEFFEDDFCVYIVLELCSRGDLHHCIKETETKKLTENELKPLLSQLVSGIQYLQSNHIMHRDLKLSNILLTHDNKIKIGDFGLAVKIRDKNEEHFTLCGTPNYIAPEVVNSSPHGLDADLWSLGCMIFTLLAGSPPFQGKKVTETLANVSNFVYEMPQHLSREAQDLISRLIQPDPRQRLRPMQILHHPFLAADSMSTLQCSNKVLTAQLKRCHRQTEAQRSTIQRRKREGISRTMRTRPIGPAGSVPGFEYIVDENMPPYSQPVRERSHMFHPYKTPLAATAKQRPLAQRSEPKKLEEHKQLEKMHRDQPTVKSISSWGTMEGHKKQLDNFTTTFETTATTSNFTNASCPPTSQMLSFSGTQAWDAARAPTVKPFSTANVIPFQEAVNGATVRLTNDGVLTLAYETGLVISIGQDGFSVHIQDHSQGNSKIDRYFVTTLPQAFHVHYELARSVIQQRRESTPRETFQVEFYTRTALMTTRSSVGGGTAECKLRGEELCPRFEITFQDQNSIFYELERQTMKYTTPQGAQYNIDLSNSEERSLRHVPREAYSIIVLSQHILQHIMMMQQKGLITSRPVSGQRQATPLGVILSESGNFKEATMDLESLRRQSSESTQLSLEKYLRPLTSSSFSAAEPLVDVTNIDRPARQSRSEARNQNTADPTTATPPSATPLNRSQSSYHKPARLSLSSRSHTFDSHTSSKMSKKNVESEVSSSIGQFTTWKTVSGIGRGRHNVTGDLFVEFVDGTRLTLNSTGTIAALETKGGAISVLSLNDGANGVSAIPREACQYLQYVSAFASNITAAR